MNKKRTILSAVLGIGLTVSAWSAVSAAAPSGHGNSGNQGKGPFKTETGSSVTQATYGETGTGTVIDIDTGTGTGSTVTEAAYGQGHRGYIGLQNAYEHVKDKPAGKRIAELLKSNYGIDVQAAAQALSASADELEAEGEVESAATLQEEAVKTDSTNLEHYKKLGKLYAKLGKAGVKAFVNGVQPNFEIQPFIKDGSTLVPFRAIAEALKAEVTWNQDEQSVTVKKGDIVVKLIIGSTTAYVNGNEITLEVPAEVYDGNTVVPARFVSESLKADVKWEQDSQSVVINQTDVTVVTP